MVSFDEVWEDYISGNLGNNEILDYIDRNHKEEFADFVSEKIKDELSCFKLKNYVNMAGKFIPFCMSVGELVENFKSYLKRR